MIEIIIFIMLFLFILYKQTSYTTGILVNSSSINAESGIVHVKCLNTTELSSYDDFTLGYNMQELNYRFHKNFEFGDKVWIYYQKNRHLISPELIKIIFIIKLDN